MKVLITGGCGFQGIHLARHLVGLGHEITTVNIASDYATANSRLLPADVHVEWADTGAGYDAPTVDAVIAACDVVINLAARASVSRSFGDPAATVITNVLGTQHVLDACARYGRPLLHASSCEVYGRTPGLLAEDARFMPTTPYAATKGAADLLVQAYAASRPDLRAVILRPSNVFGPGQRSGVFGAVIPTFISRARKGLPLRVHGDGAQTREYLYVADVVKAYVHALDLLLDVHKPNLQVYNVGPAFPAVSIREIAEIIARRFNATILHAENRAGQIAGFHLDDAVFRRTGWSPAERDFEQELLLLCDNDCLTYRDLSN